MYVCDSINDFSVKIGLGYYVGEVDPVVLK